jgi:hypothetical protein
VPAGSPREGDPAPHHRQTIFEKGVTMTQNADHVLDHFELFRGPEYQQMLANKKKMFENPAIPPKSSVSASGPRPRNTARRISPARR